MKIIGRKFAIFLALFFQTSLAIGCSSHDVVISRSFDKYSTVANGYITVTITFATAESYDLRGFYYTDHIPQPLVVFPVSVKINGIDIVNYIFESGNADDVYSGCVAYRWIFETPTDFQRNNPIHHSDTVEIVYSISSSKSGVFDLNEFHWVGYYKDALAEERAAFGHSTSADNRMIRFLGSMP